MGVDTTQVGNPRTSIQERQTERILDALQGRQVELSGKDYTTIRAFARAVQYELGDVPAAKEIVAIALACVPQWMLIPTQIAVR
jgi:hypothetical protein